MKLNHIFIDNIGYKIDQINNLTIIDDICIYCNLKIDISIVESVNRKGITTHYYELNKLYPCLTEKELLIKKLLE
jgi:hypothetical protein